ncbi:tyrosyl-DNA phosphodiesterase [Aureococcus anophagefferens]|nr:tyrosyl-DNA phosphodiesterase [Aureococcus anophagefferens]
MAGPSLGGLATTAKRAAEEAKDAFGAPDGYADLGGDRELRAEEKVERKLEKRNDRKARERARASKEETKEKEPAAASKHGSYVPMDDGLPPPAEEDRAARLRRRSSELLGRARRAVASAADKVLPAKEKPPADETACSGGGRVLASAYVDRAQLDQFDREHARYIATQKVIPKKLAAAKEAEVRAAQLADTLNEATDRCNALQAREALLAALLDQACRLDGISGDASRSRPRRRRRQA